MRTILLAMAVALAMVACDDGGEDEPRQCWDSGVYYDAGDTIPAASDPCNTCTCNADGSWSCTLLSPFSCQA